MTHYAILVLENGSAYVGESFGASVSICGEAVFCTAMTGYQETLTDPSYCGQILVAASSHIGNTGWNDEDVENPTGTIWVRGLITRNYSASTCHWRATMSLPEALQEQNIPAISGIDTRALVREIRDNGSLRGGIFPYDPDKALSAYIDIVRNEPPMVGANFVPTVSTHTKYTYQAHTREHARIAALDFGIKTSTPRHFLNRGVTVDVVPFNISLEEILADSYDGVFLSNGPGDPNAQQGAVQLVRGLLENELPLFGICFGNQILAQALGRQTFKMAYGHRGINIPVVDTATGKVTITAQNHGFAVKGEPGEEFMSDFGPATLTHYCPNDQTIEGVALASGKAFAVQYHPEAAAGPHDAQYLFDQFVHLLKGQS